MGKVFKGAVPARAARSIAVVLGLAVGLVAFSVLTIVGPTALIGGSRGPSTPPSPSPSFSLLVSPAHGFVAPDALSKGLEYRIQNYGLDPVAVEVTTSEPWAVVSPAAVSLPAGAFKIVHVAIGASPGTKALVTFTVPATGSGNIQLNRALAAVLEVKNPPPPPVAGRANPVPFAMGFLAIVLIAVGLFTFRRTKRANP